VFLLNSRSHLVSSTFRSLRRKDFTSKGAPSPEVTVPFCRVPSPKLSQRLSILYLSTCVGLRYGSIVFMLRGFSWKRGIDYFVPFRTRIHFSALMCSRICLRTPPTSLNHHHRSMASLAFSVTPSQYNQVQEY
jgi:hypothetical protein